MQAIRIALAASAAWLLTLGCSSSTPSTTTGSAEFPSGDVTRFHGRDGGSPDDSGAPVGSGPSADSGSPAVTGAADAGGAPDESGFVSGDGGAGAYVRQYSQTSTTGNGSQDQSSSLGRPVLAGSAILVFVTEYNIGGTPAGSAAPAPVRMTDSSGGSYTLLNTLNDQPDWQAVMSFVRTNAPAGNLTVSAHFAGLEWQGLVVVEVANVPASPVVASMAHVNMAATKAANSVTSGAMAAGSSPVLVVAFGVNGSDTSGAPSAGTGFTSVVKAWNWNGVENTSTLPSSLLESGSFAAPGNVAATFTPAGAGDNFCTLAAAFKN